MNEFSDNHNIHFQHVINHPNVNTRIQESTFKSERPLLHVLLLSMLQKTSHVLSSLLFSDNHTMYSDEEEEEEEEEEAEEEFAEVKYWKKNLTIDS